MAQSHENSIYRRVNISDLWSSEICWDFSAHHGQKHIFSIQVLSPTFDLRVVAPSFQRLLLGQ